MIEIQINKDVGSYDAKFIGPFTMRQTVCLCIAAPICWAIYKVLTPIMSLDVAGFFIAIPAGIAFLFGWTKPYGMRPEKFIRSIFVSLVLAPANRKYKTDNSKNDVADPHAVKAEDSQNSEEQDKVISQKPQKKPRYKVSADAVK